MELNLILAQAKAQIDKDFPIKRKQIKMTPLHKDVVLLISTASQPMRMRQVVSILCGTVENAPGWIDKVCDLVDALSELRDAGVLSASAVGWTKDVD